MQTLRSVRRARLLKLTLLELEKELESKLSVKRTEHITRLLLQGLRFILSAENENWKLKSAPGQIESGFKKNNIQRLTEDSKGLPNRRHQLLIRMNLHSIPPTMSSFLSSKLLPKYTIKNPPSFYGNATIEEYAKRLLSLNIKIKGLASKFRKSSCVFLEET
jgi:hypothetical protein